MENTDTSSNTIPKNLVGKVWALGKCEKCGLTYYDFTLGSEGNNIFRLCGCSSVVQETSDKVVCLLGAHLIKRNPKEGITSCVVERVAENTDNNCEHNWGYVEINHQIDVVMCSKCGKTVRRYVDSDFPTEEYPPHHYIHMKKIQRQ